MSQNCSLILGCKGREKNFVQFCSTTSFPILDLNSVPPTDENFKNYIFKLMKLDKGPLTDYNSIINTLQFLTANYLEQELASGIFEWISIHKKCGMYIYRSTNG